MHSVVPRRERIQQMGVGRQDNQQVPIIVKLVRCLLPASWDEPLFDPLIHGSIGSIDPGWMYELISKVDVYQGTTDLIVQGRCPRDQTG